ncbi:MAG: hypothetical protein GY809_22430, partial [Planctomycetes bacterium]|nr:hypothetical protein [Planctomycetota bacterium]
MKRMCLVLMVILCCSVVFAGPRDGLWKDVEAARDQGLPATAITLLDEIIPLAMADEAHAEAVKAICLKITLEGDIQGGRAQAKIVRLQAALAEVPEPMKPVMEAILGHWFWQYYQQNLWRYIQRTETSEPPGDDIATWNLTQILAEIDAHFTAALADDATLKAIPIAAYDDLIEKGDVPDAVRPTLYDFLVHEALTYYSAGEQGAYQPQDYFEIMVDSPAFAPVAEFLAWTPVTTQLDSPKLKALGLYQDLLAFHEADADTSAFLDADLLRLKFANNMAIGPDKAAMYMAALERFVGQWGGMDIAAEALYEWASVLQGLGDFLRAHALATQGWQEYAPSYGGILCYNLIQQIEARVVSIETERVWNAPWPEIQVTYKNINRIYFRAVSTDFVPRAYAQSYLTDMERQRLLAQPPVAQWQADLPDTVDYSTRVQGVPVPEDLDKGFYRVIASGDPSFQRADNQLSFASVWVSDLALVVRDARRDGIVEGFVLDAKSGRPIEGARVSAWQYKNSSQRDEEVRATLTDANGLFAFSYAEKRAHFLIEARVEGDRLFSASQYNLTPAMPAPSTAQQTVLFTDRALYRPGQTIQYKGICLTQNTTTDHYGVLARAKLTVVFRDTSYQEIARQEHQCNGYGSFSGSFIAPADRLLGRMHVSVAEGPGGGVPVQVEAYKRPTFQVEIDSPEDSPRLNDEVVIPARAVAYTGAPVGGAEVTWHVERTLRFPRWCWWVPVPQAQVMAQGTGLTRVDGTFDMPFVARPDLSVLEAHEPVFVYRIHADVTDTTGETRSSDSLIPIGYTALQASLEADAWQTPQSQVLLNVATESLDEVPESAACTVSVYRLKQPGAVARGPLSYTTYGYRSYGLRPLSDDTNPETWDLADLVSEVQVTTDALGRASVPVVLDTGVYRAVLDTQDRFGKPVTARESLTVVNPEATRLEVPVPDLVTAESWSVVPGETFLGLWGTGYDTGRAYVETEYRGETLSAGWTDPDRTQHAIELPITEDMRGGVTVRVTYVRENRAYLTEKIVDVPWTNKTLSVMWKRFRSKLLPGQDEQWTAVITGPDATLAVAEMVAGLYDASLDQLLGHRWIERFGGFRQETRRLTSAFANSAKPFYLIDSQWQISPRLALHIYRYLPMEFVSWINYWGPASSAGGSGGGGGGRGGSDSEVFDPDKSNDTPQDPQPGPPAVNLDGVVARTEFNETAFFYPHLRSDSDGEVQIEFTLPEDLTEWRFMGFAHDESMRSGFLTDTMVTAKDLMVQANAPRFVREGDVIEFPVKVTNQSAARQTGQVRLTFSSLRTEASMDSALGNLTTEQAFDVPSQESRTYTWRITIPDGC